MNEDDSARREFVFGLLLATVVAPLLAGLTVFAAATGVLYLRAAADRLRAARRKPARPARSHVTAQRALRHTNHRPSRRPLTTRRPGGVPH